MLVFHVSFQWENEEFNLRIYILSGKVPSDTTPDITNPILPSELVNWYYYDSSSTLAGLNPSLSQTIVNQTCQTSFECLHDYIIRVNGMSSVATSSLLTSYQQSRIILGKVCFSS